MPYLRKVPRRIGYLLAVLSGIPPAFFLVFNALFSDVVSPQERLLSFCLIAVTYGALGLVFSFIWPGPSWHWGMWLSLPAFIIVGWYSSREIERLALHLLYLAATVTPACLATLLGARLSARRNQKRKKESGE
jgi:hypothetical protein